MTPVGASLQADTWIWSIVEKGGSLNQNLVLKLLSQNLKKTNKTKEERKSAGNVAYLLF